jgi:hypothetical protein
MPHIIRDAEFKTSLGEGLWPGMWVHTKAWGHKYCDSSPLDACFLWRVEQHDGVMLLAGQGVEVLVPLTPELAEGCHLIKDQQCELLANYPAEWAAIRKLGWGVYLHKFTTYRYQTHLALSCERGYKEERFFLPALPWDQHEEHPEAIRALLATSWWRLKHPKFASALARQHKGEFWEWPNVPDVKQLHALGQAAYRTEEGSVEIGPDGTLKASGRKAWDFPSIEGEEQAE